MAFQANYFNSTLKIILWPYFYGKKQSVNDWKYHNTKYFSRYALYETAATQGSCSSVFRGLSKEEKIRTWMIGCLMVIMK